MNRNNFRAFCEQHQLLTEDAGRDWRDAGVNGTFICAVIHDQDDFEAIKPLLGNNQAYLASAKRKQGNAWFKHDGHSKIFADRAEEVTHHMLAQFTRFLDTKDDIQYYSIDSISQRHQLSLENPAFKNESEEEYFQRLLEMNDSGFIAPIYVTEPGYWDCNGNSLILSDSEMSTGFWNFSYDNWEQKVILVLNETVEKDNEEVKEEE